jgi:hypothetical protein
VGLEKADGREGRREGGKRDRDGWMIVPVIFFVFKRQLMLI